MDDKMDSIDDVRFFLREQLGFTEDVSEKVLMLYVADIIRKFNPTFSGLNNFVSDHIKISGIGQKEITVEYKSDAPEFWKQELYNTVQKFNDEYLCNFDDIRFIDNDLKELNDKHNDVLDALAYGMGITKVTLGK
jgi:hypothetical protein